MSHAPDSPICYNCGAALEGPFCAACGQKALPLNPSLHDLLHDFTHEMLHVDGRIFRSVRKLLLSPGFLTLEQVEGRRARWISPLRLYLIFSVIYFALASGGGGVRIAVTGSDQETTAELERLGFESEEQLQETVRHAFAKWTPRVMFVLVPLFAWLIHFAFRRTGRNYPQHLYFALHVHAALFAAAALAAGVGLIGTRVIAGTFEVLALLYALLYIVRAFRRVYGGAGRRWFWRAAGVVFVYYLTVVAAIVAIVVPVVLRHR